jgi:hypothetical protein
MKNSMMVFFGMIFILEAFTLARKSDNKAIAKGISIEKACNQGILSAKVRSLGGHSENCISITLRNLSASETTILIESGRRLDSDDSTKQDILVVKERTIKMAAGEERDVSIYGFCCQSTKGSPSKGEKYSIGHMADSPLIKIAEYIYENAISANIAQHAIWTVSNNHSIASVNGNNEDIRELKKYLSKIKQIEIPWYDIRYADPLPGEVFSDKAVMVSGEIPFQINNMTIGSMIVFNQNEQIVDVVFNSSPLLPDYYRYPVDLNVKNYPKGKYTIKLFTNGQKLMLERQFEI